MLSLSRLLVAHPAYRLNTAVRRSSPLKLILEQLQLRCRASARIVIVATDIVKPHALRDVSDPPRRLKRLTLVGPFVANGKHLCELAQARAEAVHTECCDDVSEDCGGGMPKSCDNGTMRLECSGNGW